MRRSIGFFGIVVGIVAASVFLPDGCGINEDASLRLRTGLPFLFGVVALLLAVRVARSAVWSALLQTIVAEAVLAMGASVLYEGGVHSTGIAAMVLAAPLGALMLAVPWVMWTVHSAVAARPGTARQAFAAMRWPVLGGLAGVLSAVWWLQHRPLDLRLAMVGLVGVQILLAFGFTALGRLRRAEAALMAMPLPPPTAQPASLADLDQPLDAGFGTAVVAADTEPFRSPRTVWLGDHAGTRAKVRRARIAATAIWTLGVIGWGAGVLGVVNSPPWKPPVSGPGFSFGHC